MDSLDKLFLLILVKVLSSFDTTSCRFSKLVDFQAIWIELGRRWILRVYPVFLKFEIHLKIKLRTGTGFFFLMEYWSEI